MSIHTLYEQNTIEEMRDALDLAHEALRWLGHVRAYIDTCDSNGANLLIRQIELFAVAECCAELHAAKDAITVDDVRELAGWDGDNATVQEAIVKALATLERLDLVKGAGLVIR